MVCAHPLVCTPTIHPLKHRLLLRLIGGKLDREPEDLGAIGLDKKKRIGGVRVEIIET
jgi:hypothetical protein